MKEFIPQSQFSGAFSPEDLSVMQSVFVKLCSEDSLASDQADKRASVATEIIALFYGGLRDEASLLDRMTARLTAA